MDEAHDDLAKAPERLAGAEREWAHHCLDNCARSASDACVQGAIAALLDERCVGHQGDRPPLPSPCPLPRGGEGHMEAKTLCRQGSPAN
jgi:hypothetical protein